MKADLNGELRDAIEDIPDEEENKFLWEDELFEQFEKALDNLKLSKESFLSLLMFIFFTLNPTKFPGCLKIQV